MISHYTDSVAPLKGHYDLLTETMLPNDSTKMAH